MLTVYQQKKPALLLSKINYKCKKIHPLTQFITEETIAFLLNLKLEEIYRIDCYQYVVYIHAKNISTFISYADCPPIIEANKPKNLDIIRWKQRWRNKFKSKYAPHFWTEFYLNKLESCFSIEQLKQWQHLLNLLKPLFSDIAIKKLNLSD